MARPLLALLVLAALLPTAAAATTLPPGPYYVEGTLDLGPEDVRVEAGTVITGPGRIVAHGNLTFEGEAGNPVEVSVPVLLLGNGTSRFAHARLWGIDGTALAVQAGRLRLDDVEFEANGAGLAVSGAARVEGDAVTFRTQAGTALDVSSGAADLTRVTFVGNGRALSLRDPASLSLADAVLEGNREHARLDLDPAARGPLVLSRWDVGPALDGGPAILLRAGVERGEAERAVRLESSRVHGAAVALRVEGPVALSGADDMLEGNAVGISLSGGRVDLLRPVLGNARDVAGAETGVLVLRNATYLRTEGVPAATLDPSVSPAWLSLPLVALLGGAWGAYAWARRRRPAPPVVVPVAAPPPPPPPVDPGEPLRAQERRILEDMLAHPGSPQSAVAERLGVSRQALHYHVKKLEARGLVRKVPSGRETRCFVADAARPLLAAPPPAAPPADMD